LRVSPRCGCGRSSDIELKTVSELLPVHDAQLLTYLKLSGLKLGLLVNFNVSVLKNGIKRIVNDLPESPEMQR
jgi:hypothetical protein